MRLPVPTTTDRIDSTHAGMIFAGSFAAALSRHPEKIAKRDTAAITIPMISTVYDPKAEGSSAASSGSFMITILAPETMILRIRSSMPTIKSRIPATSSNCLLNVISADRFFMSRVFMLSLWFQRKDLYALV